MPTRRGRRGRSSCCGVAGKQPPATTKIHTYPRHTIHPRMQDWPVGAERARVRGAVRAAISLGRRGDRKNDARIQRLRERGGRAAVELEGGHARAHVGWV